MVNIGSIPSAASVTAYDQLANGQQLLSFDIDLTLTGGLIVRPGDVVSFDGTAFSLLFGAAANDIPRGVITDAVSAIGPSDLLLSFDVAVDLGSFIATDADIVRFHDGVFSLFFDSVAAKVAVGLDLDALHCIQNNGHLLVSFDGSGVLGGISFDDEDVLEYSPASGAFELAYIGQDEHPGWLGADLQALTAGVIPPQAFDAPVIGPPASDDAGGYTVFGGSQRVSGNGTPRAKPEDTCIEIYDAGPNGRADVPPGSVDDVLLGIGGTDERGNFVASDGTPGIPVTPPLGRQQSIFAADVCSGLIGATFAVTLPAPALSLPMLLGALFVLIAIARFALGRRRLGVAQVCQQSAGAHCGC